MNVKYGNISVVTVVVFNIFHLKEVRDECEKLRDTISSKEKKLARMNKAFGNKVRYYINLLGLFLSSLCTRVFKS